MLVLHGVGRARVPADLAGMDPALGFVVICTWHRDSPEDS